MFLGMREAHSRSKARRDTHEYGINQRSDWNQDTNVHCYWAQDGLAVETRQRTIVDPA